MAASRLAHSGLTSSRKTAGEPRSEGRIWRGIDGLCWVTRCNHRRPREYKREQDLLTSVTFVFLAICLSVLKQLRVNMRAFTSASVVLGLASIASAVTYGNNHVPLRKDSEIVASAFEDVEDIKLLSPAFLTSDFRLPGFTNGTQGPSSQDDMGELGF